MPIFIENYADQNTTPLNDLLQEILDFTLQNHPHATMVSGHVQGQFLRFISGLIKPKKILEIGTFTGFSAICLSDGLQADGELHTLELRQEDADTAQAFFNRSPFAKQIKLHIGNALEIIPTLKHSWDIVFIDADKVSYAEYYKLVLPNLATGGLIIADNVLFHGQVLEDEIKGKNPKAIAAFNEMVQNDVATENVLLTVRDGLMLIRKNKQ
jgi:caffeoyl-CoA O-methyltransferase